MTVQSQLQGSIFYEIVLKKENTMSIIINDKAAYGIDDVRIIQEGLSYYMLSNLEWGKGSVPEFGVIRDLVNRVTLHLNTLIEVEEEKARLFFAQESARFKVGDIVTVTEEAPPGFHIPDVNMVVIEIDVAAIVVACSNGAMLYANPREIRHLKEGEGS